MGILYNKPQNPAEGVNETHSTTQFKYKFYNGVYIFFSEGVIRFKSSNCVLRIFLTIQSGLIS